MSEITFQPLGNAVAAGPDQRIADIDPRLTRTHYFDGRLLTAEDLTRDQTYLDQRVRELGRVLGNGVMSGLELTLDRFTGRLTLEPGLALTRAGRVLELGSRLVVDIGDRALVATLNNGQFHRLDRALYAVVLRYVDVGTDIAEVFPRDLGAKRGAQYALITECVQLGLVPLPVPLPQQSALLIRSRLMREFLGDDPFAGLIPEDAVPLGVLAVQEDTPQWLDPELLRRPLRGAASIGDLQADLSRQYEALLTDVLAARRSGGLDGDFHASEYFSLLPPVGSVPKAAVDPTSGRQAFFPENYPVAIAPVRQSDIELLKEESLGLPPIDLRNGEPVDIVILAPLTNLDYGHYASLLEREFEPADRRLPQIDLLKLKLYPVRPVHALDTDAAAWTDIWSRIGETQALYVRRPTRAAETAISGIVVARGTSLPEPPEEPVPSPADEGGLILDENTVFLNRLDLDRLHTLRPEADAAGATAFDQLRTDFGNDAATVALVASVLTRIERRYDSLVWQTLLALATADRLDEFLTALLDANQSDPTAGVVQAALTELEADAPLIAQWSTLAAEEPTP
jgi:hypothetical protein